MVDRPIIFSAPMILAMIDGRKFQTRRLETSPLRTCSVGDRLWVRETCRAVELDSGLDCVEYQASQDTEDDWGDAIEDSLEASDRWGQMRIYGRKKNGPAPRALKRERGGISGKWVPSIHMPRWASRLTLTVEAVRFEPLREISVSDVLAEGAPIDPDHCDTTQDGSNPIMCIGDRPWTSQSPHAWYRRIWDSLHTDDGERWDDNPNVVAMTFSVARGNLDRLAA